MCIVKSLCCFSLHFPVDIQCGASFYIHICCLYILVTCLLRSLTSFLIQCFCFLIVKFWEFFVYFVLTVLYQICLWQILSLGIYFSPCLFFMLFSYVDCSFTFSSRSFIAFWFTFELNVHFELPFVKSVRWVSRFVFCTLFLNYSSTICWKNIFRLLNCFCSFISNQFIVFAYKLNNIELFNIVQY